MTMTQSTDNPIKEAQIEISSGNWNGDKQPFLDFVGGLEYIEDDIEEIRVYDGGAVDAIRIKLSRGYKPIPQSLIRRIYQSGLAIASARGYYTIELRRGRA